MANFIPDEKFEAFATAFEAAESALVLASEDTAAQNTSENDVRLAAREKATDEYYEAFGKDVQDAFTKGELTIKSQLAVLRSISQSTDDDHAIRNTVNPSFPSVPCQVVVNDRTLPDVTGIKKGDDWTGFRLSLQAHKIDYAPTIRLSAKYFNENMTTPVFFVADFHFNRLEQHDG